MIVCYTPHSGRQWWDMSIMLYYSLSYPQHESIECYTAFARSNKLSYGSVKAYIILDLHVSTQELDMLGFTPEFAIE